MKNGVLLLSTVTLFVVACSSPRSSDPMVASLDSIVNSVVDTARFNGNVLFARNGNVIYQKSFGWTNYDTKEQLNDSTLFELASVSKQFTAMGIMLLKEQGKLSYEDDVRKYLPELPFEGMTIRHFLTHTSGLSGYMDSERPWVTEDKIHNNQDILAMLVARKPEPYFKPGEQWSYSNTAYTLLATIIERVSGKSYGEFLKENIFAPLGMSRSRNYHVQQSEPISNYAR